MKILVAGDFCPQQRVAELFEKNDFVAVLGSVRPVITDVDYAIVNLECPICYGGEKPIEKLGPNLKCSERGVNALKWAGFDCVTLANNHSMDYGEEGLKNTLEACSKCSIDTVGAGLNLQKASKVFYRKFKNKTLAIINSCEHEFSIATDQSGGSNPLNPIQQYYSIKEAREKADYVMVIVHGGHEHFQLPSLRMKETYRFFIDAGADVVINHHQHCYSGYEVYNGKPIFYGIGNFCFDGNRRKKALWHEGYLVLLTIEGESVAYDCIPYIQCKENASVQLLSSSQKKIFDEQIEKINSIICDDSALVNDVNDYYRSSSRHFDSLFEPFDGRWLRFLKNKGLLPSFVSRKKIVKAKDFICCESHRDKLFYYLLNKYN